MKFIGAVEATQEARDDDYLTYIKIAMLIRWVRLYATLVLFTAMVAISVLLTVQRDWFVVAQVLITVCYATAVRNAWRWDAQIK